MTQPIKLCGVILAAGKSSRMGTDKALLPWPPAASDAVTPTGCTLLTAAIAALKPVTDFLIVVAGSNAGNLSVIARGSGASIVQNPAPERGQFSSLHVGLREVLARGFSAAAITPVDCPPLSAESLDRLRAAFAQAVSAGKWGVAPENRGRHGHPLIVARDLIDAFLSAPFTSNAREVRRVHERCIEYIPVPDSLLSVDVNTPEQYAALPGAT
ncbi:MAG: nucleotidyltransferase family protein [Terracidiphilus sp.]